MAHENLTYEDLLRIVELIKSSERFSEFRLKVGDIEVELKRSDRTTVARVASDGSSAVTPATDAQPSEPSLAASTNRTEVESSPPSQAASAAGTPEHAPRPREHAAACGWPPDAVVVRSPMVGTFYRAPAPGAPPFVTIGQRVEAETTVCIIEVMKLMNSIPAGASGVVTHILMDDAEPVGAHAPLIVLDPTPDST